MIPLDSVHTELPWTRSFEIELDQQGNFWVFHHLGLESTGVIRRTVRYGPYNNLEQMDDRLEKLALQPERNEWVARMRRNRREVSYH